MTSGVLARRGRRRRRRWPLLLPTGVEVVRVGRRRRGVRRRGVEALLLLAIPVLVLDYVEVDGQNARHFGGDERTDRHDERRSVSIAELRFVHRHLRLVSGLFRYGTDVNYDSYERT